MEVDMGVKEEFVDQRSYQMFDFPWYFPSSSDYYVVISGVIFWWLLLQAAHLGPSSPLQDPEKQGMAPLWLGILIIFS
jgi:hypothetical protein